MNRSRKSGSGPGFDMGLGMVVAIPAIIVIVFGLDLFLPLERLGLRPRYLSGLTGIIAMPFLHASLTHLLSNLVPLTVLLFLTRLIRPRPLATVVGIAVLGGLLTWVFARGGNHIGASGLVFGLATFLMASGLHARSLTAVAVAVVTLFLYGATILGGVVPTGGAVSWDGHLAGAVAGIVVARLSVGRSGTPSGRL